MRPIKLLITLLALLPFTQHSVMAQVNSKPQIVPAVSSWKGAEGTKNITSIKIVKTEGLPEDMQLVAKLFADQFPTNIKARNGAGAPTLVKFKKDDSIKNTEAYKLEIDDHIIISASSAKGQYYATRTLLQMQQQGPLPKGTIHDAPRYEVRSLLLDVGRKFIPVEGLKDWIKMMGWLKINELHLHLNDNSWGRYPGYRLESKKFPGLSSKDGFYTFKQIRELQDFAKLHAVVIVPEIDSPGHSLAFTTYRPELAHREMDRNGFGLAYLDLNNPDAVKFMEDIWDEVCPLFDSPLVHIGTDEYRINLVKKKEDREQLGEAFRKYINHLNKYITTKHGKEVRTWSGYEHLPGTTEPDKNIIIDMWETSDAKNKVKAGYKVVNSSHFYTYIVPGAPYYGVNNKFIYDTWTPKQFSNKPAGMLDDTDPGLMGGKLHIWNDYGPTGYTWNEIARLSLPSMAAISEKFWGTKGAKDHAQFLTYSEKLTSNIPEVSILNRPAQPNKGNTVWKLQQPKEMIGNTNQDLNLEADNLEYPWTASFTLTRHNDIAGNEILISSDLAAIYLDLSHTTTDKKTKKKTTKRGVGIVRANQAPGFDPLTAYNPDALVFDYQAPVGEQVTIKLVGERRKTSLYVNGKLIQSIDKQTLCPLTRLGVKLPRGVHATLTEAVVLSEADVPKPITRMNWAPSTITENAKAYKINLNGKIKKSGNLQVTFQYTAGLHRLDISKVELLENGKVISIDEHAGITGGKSSNNTYALKLEKFDTQSKYAIRYTANSDGGTDSKGKITVIQN